MDVVRYIPTGSNKQLLKYKFITDEKTLLEIKLQWRKNENDFETVSKFSLQIFCQRQE